MIHEFPSKAIQSVDFGDVKQYYDGMNDLFLGRQKAVPRITAARMACIIGKPLAISYVGIYAAASLIAGAVGVEHFLDTFLGFVAAHLQTQLPLLLLLVSVWVVCVLADSLSVGTVWGYASDALALPGSADLHQTLLRIAERLHGLAGTKRISSLALAGPITSFLTSRTSPPPPLATGWSPSTHPNLDFG